MNSLVDTDSEIINDIRYNAIWLLSNPGDEERYWELFSASTIEFLLYIMNSNILSNTFYGIIFLEIRRIVCMYDRFFSPESYALGII